MRVVLRILLLSAFNCGRRVSMLLLLLLPLLHSLPALLFLFDSLLKSFYALLWCLRLFSSVLTLDLVMLELCRQASCAARRVLRE